jgi:hypothetical protein
MRIAAAVGLLALLVQLLFPPVLFYGHTTNDRPVAAVRYRPIWSGLPYPYIRLRGSEVLLTGEVLFPESSEILWSRMIIPAGITIVLAGLGMTLAPRQQR